MVIRPEALQQRETKFLSIMILIIKIYYEMVPYVYNWMPTKHLRI